MCEQEKYLGWMYTRQCILIYRRDSFILRVPGFFIGFRKYPKTLRRVLFNMNTRTWMNTTLSREKSIIDLDFSFFSLVPVFFKLFKFIFQHVSVNAVMAQTFLLGVKNLNTGVSRREIEVFDLQAWQSHLTHDTWQVHECSSFFKPSTKKYVHLD